MILKITALTAATITILSSTAARADYPSMHPLVEKLPAGAEKCGLTEASVNAALLSAMRYNRIENDAGSLVTAYVHLAAIENSGVCQMSLTVQIYGRAPAKFGKKYILTSAQFCRQGVTFANYRAADASVVLMAVKDYFELCLSEVDAENSVSPDLLDRFSALLEADAAIAR